MDYNVNYWCFSWMTCSIKEIMTHGHDYMHKKNTCIQEANSLISYSKEYMLSNIKTTWLFKLYFGYFHFGVGNTVCRVNE